MKVFVSTALRAIAVATFGFAAQIGSSNASTIIGSVGVTAPSQNGTALAINMINQSGLSSGYVSGVTDFASYTASTTHNNACGPNCWANVPPVGFSYNLDFNLGSSIALDGLALWNYHSSLSVKSFDVFSATNALFSGATLVGSFVAANESSATAATAQVFSFGSITAPFIRLRVNSNYGSTSQVAIGEVAFRSANIAPVPIPATLPLLVIALGGLGIASRRRKEE